MLIHGFDIEVTRKKVKRINLKIYIGGKIKVSIPKRLNMKKLEDFVFSKKAFIEKSLKTLSLKKKETLLDENNLKDLILFGKKYKLFFIFDDVQNNCVKFVKKKSLDENTREEKILYVYSKRKEFKYIEKILITFYKKELEKMLSVFLNKWKKTMNLEINSFKIRKMKRVWGNCNITKKEIKFNLDLVKKSTEEIESVVVHELIHLLEKGHNKRFYNLMSFYLPNWKKLKIKLNK